MKKNIKLSIVNDDWNNKQITFCISEQSHIYNKFGTKFNLNNNFKASNGVILSSYGYPEIILNENGIKFFVRGTDKTKNFIYIHTSYDIFRKINDAINEYNNYEFEDEFEEIPKSKIIHYPGEPCNLPICTGYDCIDDKPTSEVAKEFRFEYTGEKRKYYDGEWIVNGKSAIYRVNHNGIGPCFWILRAIPVNPVDQNKIKEFDYLSIGEETLIHNMKQDIIKAIYDIYDENTIKIIAKILDIKTKL
jgi:hypothetical protein